MNISLMSSSPIINATLGLLILFSIVTWSIIAIKLWQYWRDGKENRVFNESFWVAGEWQQAARLSEEMPGNQAHLAKAGFAELRDAQQQGGDMKHLGSPQDGLERSLRQTVQNLQHKLEGGLAILASIGSTAPFVGLFGTVWGIMHALTEISKTGSASLDVVAGPIGEALIATAIGIATAIPAVLAYNFFLRRMKLSLANLENFAHDFMRLAAKHDYKV
ncbi:MAG: flagellar motor protein MotA [Gallionellales bacterium RIFCSPLOWO2_02_FULL_57_47]|jgi:biopolymer transport protein ExbB|nr:MAG: flagellar motor protein MotA [Gallionellales bacterium RIFCSPLOWO2_02_FULL_57_47]OGT10997.1 MAG: flagellar motor protein MotA [Gallionellales bacterium RIFCSPHIGHO2_02_FULL_57_16]